MIRYLSNDINKHFNRKCSKRSFRVNTSGANMLIYAFHSVAGYSKIGSYTGNGSDDGPIINTGFEPAWLMIKVITGSGDGWFMVDNKRDTSNPRGIRVFANSDVGDASEAGAQVDFFSNGFQVKRFRCWARSNK